MESFGVRFKKLRLNMGLTQEQLVNEFNQKYGYAFSKTTISQYENNRRTPEMNTIRKLADYFDVSLDYLLCNDLSVVRELGNQYGLYINSEGIEVKEFIELFKELIKADTIKNNNKYLLEEEKIILKNCLEIAYELINRKI